MVQAIADSETLPDVVVAESNGIESAAGNGARTSWALFFDEAFAARHNREIWKTGEDGTYQWRNQADGFFE